MQENLLKEGHEIFFIERRTFQRRPWTKLYVLQVGTVQFMFSPIPFYFQRMVLNFIEFLPSNFWISFWFFWISSWNYFLWKGRSMKKALCLASWQDAICVLANSIAFQRIVSIFFRFLPLKFWLGFFFWNHFLGKAALWTKLYVSRVGRCNLWSCQYYSIFKEWHWNFWDFFL